MGTHDATFQIVKTTAEIVWLVDLDESGRRSVTNDAERVVDQLYKLYGDRRIIYRDSMGNWDELIHDHGRFVRFAPARDMAPPTDPATRGQMSAERREKERRVAHYVDQAKLVGLEHHRDELAEALREIAELTSRQQLPLTAQINSIASAALAKVQS